jgi:hypothetical protein
MPPGFALASTGIESNALIDPPPLRRSITDIFRLQLGIIRFDLNRSLIIGHEKTT